jgi:hypothetical protein
LVSGRDAHGMRSRKVDKHVLVHQSYE